MTSSRFSDFIRNATPEEKAEVYGRVMDMACLAQRTQAHNCKRPAVANMDHAKGEKPGELVQMVNRMCMSCGVHWYGPEGAVTEYTRPQWDAWIATAFDEVEA